MSSVFKSHFVSISLHTNIKQNEQRIELGKSYTREVKLPAKGCQKRKLQKRTELILDKQKRSEKTTARKKDKHNSYDNTFQEKY